MEVVGRASSAWYLQEAVAITVHLPIYPGEPVTTNVDVCAVEAVGCCGYGWWDWGVGGCCCDAPGWA